MNTKTKDSEIRLTREFDAPRELVFDAFTSPGKIGQWWGPNGFTTTTKSMNFKVGGEWIFTMHGPAGTDYPNRIVYTQIKKSKLIKYDHFGHMDNRDDPPHFKVKITFEETDGWTKIDMRMLFPTKENRDKTVEFGAIEGGQQTLNRLAEFLKKTCQVCNDVNTKLDLNKT